MAAFCSRHSFFFFCTEKHHRLFWERGGVNTNTPNPFQLFSTVAPSKDCCFLRLVGWFVFSASG